MRFHTSEIFHETNVTEGQEHRHVSTEADGIHQAEPVVVHVHGLAVASDLQVFYYSYTLAQLRRS